MVARRRRHGDAASVFHFSTRQASQGGWMEGAQFACRNVLGMIDRPEVL